jgi:hypothetical protein
MAVSWQQDNQAVSALSTPRVIAYTQYSLSSLEDGESRNAQPLFLTPDSQDSTDSQDSIMCFRATSHENRHVAIFLNRIAKRFALLPVMSSSEELER